MFLALPFAQSSQGAAHTNNPNSVRGGGSLDKVCLSSTDGSDVSTTATAQPSRHPPCRRSPLYNRLFDGRKCRVSAYNRPTSTQARAHLFLLAQQPPALSAVRNGSGTG